MARKKLLPEDKRKTVAFRLDPIIMDKINAIQANRLCTITSIVELCLTTDATLDKLVAEKKYI